MLLPLFNFSLKRGKSSAGRKQQQRLVEKQKSTNTRTMHVQDQHPQQCGHTLLLFFFFFF